MGMGLLACMFIAAAGSANAEIVRCIGKNGLVLMTDVPCNTAANTPKAPAAAKAKQAGGRGSPQAKRFAAAEQARAVASANRSAKSRRLPLDVAMMKEARITMLSIDQTSILQRQEALAEQAARPGFWELWRS